MDIQNNVTELLDLVPNPISTEEQIVELHQRGTSKEDIIKALGVTRRYVNRILSKKLLSSAELTIPNYMKAVKNGYNTKDDLSAYFGVCKKSLIKFEKETNITARVVRYYYTRGYEYKQIARIAHIKVGDIDKYIVPERNLYAFPPTLESLRKDLIQVIATFEDMAEFDGKTTVDLGTLKRMLEKLQNLT